MIMTNALIDYQQEPDIELKNYLSLDQAQKLSKMNNDQLKRLVRLGKIKAKEKQYKTEQTMIEESSLQDYLSTIQKSDLGNGLDFNTVNLLIQAKDKQIDFLTSQISMKDSLIIKVTSEFSKISENNQKLNQMINEIYNDLNKPKPQGFFGLFKDKLLLKQ